MATYLVSSILYHGDVGEVDRGVSACATISSWSPDLDVDTKVLIVADVIDKCSGTIQDRGRARRTVLSIDLNRLI